MNNTTMSVARLFWLLILVSAPFVYGHDMRLTANRHQISPGERISLRLWLGDRLENEQSYSFHSNAIVGFQLGGPGGEVSLPALSFAMPSYPWSIAEEGTYVVTMSRISATTTLPASKFEAYLKEEELQDIVQQRRRIGESGRPGRERFSRFLKTLLQVGAVPGADNMLARPTGLALDILPMVNPYRLGVGENLPIRVLFQGQPLIGRRVQCLIKTATGEVDIQEKTTNIEGRVSFRLNANGETLIRLVHMVRSQPNLTEEWRSYWAALTFAVAE